MKIYSLQLKLLVFLLFIVPVFLYADIITVSSDGDYQEIQDAIDAASDGDEIIVSPGTYSRIYFKGKNITVRSTDPENSEIVEQTIISGANATRVVYFTGDELSTCTLSGFTIANGITWMGAGINGEGCKAAITHNRIVDNTIYLNPIKDKNYGAGIMDCDGLISDNYIANNTSGGGIADCDGVIENNIIENNTAQKPPGGGLLEAGGALYNCNGTIRNNIIRDNQATKYASGGALGKCHGIIEENEITGNSSGFEGGAFFQCNGTIRNNIISENKCNRFGGAVSGGDFTFYNNIVTSNTASVYGGAFYSVKGKVLNSVIYANRAARDGGAFSSSNITIKNSIIWGNTGENFHSSTKPTYSCVEGGASGTGNISGDPLFINPGTGDFHLQPESPCIDAGALAEEVETDIEGNPRPTDAVSEPRGDGSDYDMGAYETIVPINSDSIADHILDINRIPEERRDEADKNNDAIIDTADIVTLQE